MPLIPALVRKNRRTAVLSQPGLESEFYDSQELYIEKPCLRNKELKIKKNY